MTKTYQPKASEIKRTTQVLDASGQPVGRLATKIAMILMGKNSPEYSAHMDMGDIVKVTNAGKVVLTGRKAAQKVYQKHSNYPGGFKEVAVGKYLTENPARVIELAVKRMLPKNRLQDPRMRRLTITRGE